MTDVTNVPSENVDVVDFIPGENVKKLDEAEWAADLASKEEKLENFVKLVVSFQSSVIDIDDIGAR